MIDNNSYMVVWMYDTSRCDLKTVHIPMDDEDYDKLVKAKGEKPWLEFVMQLVKRA